MKLCLIWLLMLVPATAPAQIFGKKPAKAPQQREVKIQKTSLSKDQEAQLGKEAAAEVERTMEVVHDPESEAWLNQIGKRLAQTPQANAYPYYFKLVNEPSINAFALPGGPMYVHTGLIKSADSEDQVAGVLAHEMSHVALRHGAYQMSKQQTWQTILGVVQVAAGLAGSGDRCTLLCEAVQLGGGLAENAVLMRFSRDLERDADLNGARMMSSAGYNPLALAHFFEKLESQSGSSSVASGLTNFLSSHPAPGNRRQYIEEDVQFYSKRDYTAATGNFTTVQRAVAALPPPKKKPAALLQAVQAKQRQGVPQGFKDLQTQGFSIAYPAAWQAAQSPQGGGVFVAPAGGVSQPQGGGVELIAGALIDYFQPVNGKPELSATTNELLQGLKKSDANMRLESPRPIQLGGQSGLVTKLTTKTSSAQEPEQTVYLYTALRGELLFNLALAAPPSRIAEMEPIFQQMTQSLQFRDQ